MSKLCLLAIAMLPGIMSAQLSPSAARVGCTHAMNSISVFPNLTYLTALVTMKSNWMCISGVARLLRNRP